MLVNVKVNVTQDVLAIALEDFKTNLVQMLTMSRRCAGQRYQGQVAHLTLMFNLLFS